MTRYNSWEAAWALALLLSALIGSSTAVCSCEPLEVLQHDNPIANTYLVTHLNDSTTMDGLPEGVTAEAWTASQVSQLKTCFINLTEETLESTRSACNVAYIETDALGEFDDPAADALDASPTLERRLFQGRAPWSLVAISQADSAGKSVSDINGDMAADPSYSFARGGGSGVYVYLIDSGINHLPEFNGPGGFDRLIDEIDLSDDGGFHDTAENPNGHGTLVASAIGGHIGGVAKWATLRSVKANSNRRPHLAKFVTAVRQVIERHNVRKTRAGFKGSIINITVQLDKSPAGTMVLKAASDAGISIVASAGNYGYDEKKWPCHEANVICVGAASPNFTPWYFDSSFASNWHGVDIWAPGSELPLMNRAGTVQQSRGTSPATGYVSGALAVIYSLQSGVLTPGYAKRLLMAQASNIMTFPSIQGFDWGNPTTAFLNTGFRKGQALNPKKAYINGPRYSE